MSTQWKEQITQRTLIARQRFIIGLFCGELPPEHLFREDETGLVVGELQDWIGMRWVGNAEYGTQPTALSILEAAETIAASQIYNGYEELYNGYEELA